MARDFTPAELKAIVWLANDYVQCGGLDPNIPADAVGVMFVASIRDKAKELLS